MGASEWTVIGTGIAIIVANAGLFAWLRGDLAKLSRHVDALSERIANAGLFAWLRGDLAKLSRHVDALSERIRTLRAHGPHGEDGSADAGSPDPDRAQTPRMTPPRPLSRARLTVPPRET